jgi:hypothetical protein
MVYGHKPAFFRGKQFKFRKLSIDPGRVRYVRNKQGAAAVKLEIEITSVLPGLYKKFYTAVVINRGLKIGMNTSYISIPYMEKSVEVAVVIEHLTLNKRQMEGAFGPEAIYT